MTASLPQVALVVDDEPLIAMNTAELLQDLGFAASEVFNAQQAMDYLLAHRDVSLLVTDIDMPGSMNGLGLANAVAERWPNIKIIVTSGRAIPSAAELPPDAKFITKPFYEQHLRIALN